LSVYGLCECRHDRTGAPVVLGEKCNGRSRRHADEVDFNSLEAESLGDRPCQAGARFAWIVADNDP